MKFRRAAARLSLAAATAVAFSISSPAQATKATRANTAAQAHLGKGYQYIQNRRYAEAADEFQAALALNSRLIQARYQLAICRFALGDFKDARSEFNQVEREMPGSSQVAYYLGRLDLRESNYEAAITEFLKISSSPPFPDTSYYLGSAYLYQGNLAQAQRWLREAARTNPRDFRVADHLARVYQREKQRAKAEEEYALSSRLRQYYDSAASQSVACDRALESQSLRRARSVCQQLFDSQDQDKLILLGMIYGQHGDYQDALRPLEDAARIDPDSWAAEHNLGLTYFRLRSYSKALGPLRRAVQLRPEYFGSSALLGATLYALKQDEEAFQILKHAHELNPQDQDTGKLLFNESLVLARRRFLSRDYSGCVRFLEEASALRPGDPGVQQRMAAVKRLQASATAQ